MGRPSGFTVFRQQSIANIGSGRGNGLWGWEELLVDDGTFADVTVAFTSEQVRPDPDSRLTQLKVTFDEVTKIVMWDDNGNDLPDDQITDDVRNQVIEAAKDAFSMHSTAIADRISHPFPPAP